MSSLGWIVVASLAGGVLSAGAAAVALFLRPAWISTLVSYAIGALLGAAFLEVIPHAFENGEPHRQQRDAGEQGQRAQAHVQEDLGDGPVEGVAADHVPHLVGDQGPELLLVQQLKRGGVQHDEGIVHPVGAGVEDRGLGDVQLGNPGPVEGGAGLDMDRPGPGELVGADLDRVALEQEPDAPFTAQQGQDLPHHFFESGNAAQRLESSAIRRVFPADRGDFRESPAGTRGEGRGGATAEGAPAVASGQRVARSSSVIARAAGTACTKRMRLLAVAAP